jgi:hypothetical protein
MKPHGLRSRRLMKAAATIVAFLVGIIVITVGMGGLYDECGPLCWQGLLQAQRERY